MGIVSGHRIVNNLLSGALSGAQLETLLATGINLASFIQALNSASQARALAESTTAFSAVIASTTAINAVIASSTAMNAVAANSTAMNSVIASTTVMNSVAASTTAMNAVAASTTAMNAVIASTTAMNTVIASTTAMNAVAASTTAMNAVAASTTAKMACFNSDVALAAFAGSATALTALRAVGAYSVISKNGGSGTQTIPGPTAGQSYILLGVSDGSGATVQSITNINTRRSGSTRPITVADNANSATNAQTVTLCTPLVSPFTFTTSTTDTFIWYFGLLRCDV